MGLPSPDSLSLSEAAALVRDQGDCSEKEAREALRRAGLDGRLNGSGSIPLSVHPNRIVRERHRARTREAIRPTDWDSNIDWNAGTVGPYSSVLIERASIEAWLGAKRAAPAPALKNAPDAMILKAIGDEYDRAERMNKKPPNVREIVELVQGALRAKGSAQAAIAFRIWQGAKNSRSDAGSRDNVKKRPSKQSESQISSQISHQLSSFLA
jgi:hypothetical protein